MHLALLDSGLIPFDIDGDCAMSWYCPTGDAFHPVDPYLFELGWRAWYCLVEENILGRMGFTDTLVEFLETGV